MHVPGRVVGRLGPVCDHNRSGHNAYMVLYEPVFCVCGHKPRRKVQMQSNARAVSLMAVTWHPGLEHF